MLSYLKQTIHEGASFLQELIENGLLISLDIFLGSLKIAVIFNRFDCNLHNFSSNLKLVKIGHNRHYAFI